MDPILKAKWVTALRSGERRQGLCGLYMPSERSYCCLGVLAEVMGYDRNDFIGMGYISSYLERIKQTDKIPFDLLIEKEYGSLNDCGSEFAYIADQIEKDKRI